jgi:large subunit ribosomal protein L28
MGRSPEKGLFVAALVQHNLNPGKAIFQQENDENRSNPLGSRIGPRAACPRLVIFAVKAIFNVLEMRPKAKNVRCPMGMQCAITGKKPAKGNHYARRGKAKYLGGVGRKVTGITKRTFKPNLQRIKVVIDGKVKTVRVSVKAIRSGLVQRPIKRKPFQMPNL